MKMRGRAEHSLFSEAARPQDNYDVEAVKLSHARQVWHGVEDDKRPPSISSEETISDYEQVRREGGREGGGKSSERERDRESGRGHIALPACRVPPSFLSSPAVWHDTVVI